MATTATSNAIVLLAGLLPLTFSVQILRSVSFNNSITQSDAVCGETVKGLLTISINAEPGTARKIALQFTSNNNFASIQAAGQQFENEVEWPQYVKRVDLTVPLEVILKVPGCEPSKDVAFTISGQYEGGTCEEETTECLLNLPDTEISIVTEKPRIGSLIVPEFNVIRGKWTKPIKLMIKHRLLQPEQLTVTPQSLLNGALEFKASLIGTDAIQFSYTHPYFPRRTYMYVKAKEDLALSQRLEIEYNLKCPECKFSQFPPKSDGTYPVYVAESSKQKFVPFYIPTMKIWHKYCFKFALNQPPIAEVGVTFELCGAMLVEPREVTFSKDPQNRAESTSKRFCITPVQETQCTLKFFLTGPMVHQFLKPDPIVVFSRETEPLFFTFPTEITVTNRKISEPHTFSIPTVKGQYLKVTLTPNFSVDPGFFIFEPAALEIDTEHMISTNMEFFVTPSVDCPMRAEESNATLYYVVHWSINGSLGNYMKPPPIYIKVTENTEEVGSLEAWCPEHVDCADPPMGQTCVMDECVISPMMADCQPLFVQTAVKPDKLTDLTTTQYIMAGSVALFVLINLLSFFGCFRKKTEEEEDTTDEIEEKKIFNTESNLREAEAAIENLLWQLYKHEQNLEVNRKYHKDIHNEEYYDD